MTVLYARLAGRAVAGRLRQAPGAVLLILLVISAGVATTLGQPTWELGVDVAAADAPPSLRHPLGTDHLGRDIALRTLGATAAWLVPAGLAALIAVLWGAALGLLLASPWRPVARLARLLEAVASAVPTLVLAVLAASITGAGLPVVGAVTGLGGGLGVAAGVAGRYRELRDRGYLDAHAAHGTPLLRRLLSHTVLGHAPDVLARGAIDAAAAMLVAEATLSYLGGFGTPEPTPSWGNMMAFEWGTASAVGWLAPLLALLATVAALDRAGAALTAPPASTARPALRARAEQQPDRLLLHDVRVELAGRTLLAVDELQLGAGELVAVVGPSGAGKTLLLHACAAQGVPRLALVRQHAGRSLDPLQRVRAQLAAGDPAAALAAVGLAPEVAQAWPHELSGGMATRTALARELSRGCRWLLVDEPLSGLDPLAALPVLHTLRALADQGAGVLWTTHHLALAARHADRVVVVQEGGVRAVLQRPFPADLTPLLRAVEGVIHRPGEAPHV